MALDANVQPKPPPMPGMVSTMAQSQAGGLTGTEVANPFGYKNAQDIYKMSDAERTSYYSDFRSHMGASEIAAPTQVDSLNGRSSVIVPGSVQDINSQASQADRDYYAGLGDDIKADMNHGYLTQAQRTLGLQQAGAKDFRSKMPNLAQEMGQNLKVQGNQGLSAANQGTKQNMSSRGLLNSNINRGAQAGNRARTQLGVAQGTADINSGLINAADSMDSQAIGTGVAVQQNAQNIQNQIYSQAMARLNAQNSQAGGLMGLAATGAMLAASDRRVKENITPISNEDVAELKATLKPYAFNYINDEFGTGDWVGVMAQDLEKSKLGRGVVVTNKEGVKMIDIRKVASLFLAAIAEG